jgi:hypothetical protein
LLVERLGRLAQQRLLVNPGWVVPGLPVVMLLSRDANATINYVYDDLAFLT